MEKGLIPSPASFQRRSLGLNGSPLGCSTSRRLLKHVIWNGGLIFYRPSTSDYCHVIHQRHRPNSIGYPIERNPSHICLNASSSSALGLSAHLEAHAATETATRVLCPPLQAEAPPPNAWNCGYCKVIRVWLMSHQCRNAFKGCNPMTVSLIRSVQKWGS